MTTLIWRMRLDTAAPVTLLIFARVKCIDNPSYHEQFNQIAVPNPAKELVVRGAEEEALLLQCVPSQTSPAWDRDCRYTKRLGLRPLPLSDNPLSFRPW